MAMAATTQQNPANQLVLEERDGKIVTLRLNRPDRLNALNVELGRELVHALLRAGEDKEIFAVRLIGAGRAFCAGGDLQLLQDLRKRNDSKELEKLLATGKEICLAIAGMSKPVLAAVNGPAAGGGMNLAIACDMRVASDQAKFGESFAQIGLYPDFGGTFFLPRLVGRARSAELFWTSTKLSPEDALRMGIVTRVIPSAQFEEESKKIAEDLASAAPLSVRDSKHAMTGNNRAALTSALDEEIRLQIHCFHSEDCLEGLNAFLEKRKPNFRGH
jgi:2-(1,2-epoxy-1,2-dihydrophenyl)acetyl-CoA isomerase